MKEIAVGQNKMKLKAFYFFNINYKKSVNG